MSTLLTRSLPFWASVFRLFRSIVIMISAKYLRIQLQGPAHSPAPALPPIPTPPHPPMHRPSLPLAGDLLVHSFIEMIPGNLTPSSIHTVIENSQTHIHGIKYMLYSQSSLQSYAIGRSQVIGGLRILVIIFSIAFQLFKLSFLFL